LRVTVRVPATCANLGPGFDCLGLALDLYNHLTLETPSASSVVWEGEGADELPADGTDMVSRAIRFAAKRAGRTMPEFALRGRNRIPLQRGLGSSAAACVAGIMLCGRVLGLQLEANDVMGLAAELEGHSDNSAAATLGGLTVAYSADRAVRLEPATDLRPVLLVPDLRLPTDEARRALGETVSRADAVHNLARTALAVVALTQRPDLLGEALDDRLHQAARLELVPEARRVFEELRARGVPVCVSGAGPTLLAFDARGEGVPDPGEGWNMLIPAVATEGASYLDA
jgi:homoserine kinase